MNTQVHSVIQLHQKPTVPGVAPKVWTPERINALMLLNGAMRWLRSQRIKPLSVNLEQPRPTIVVSAMCEAALVAAGHGKSTMRMSNGQRQCSVIVEGCTVQWEFILHG